MDEKDWLILKTLHEKKSITKTAAAVYISQPALTNRLHQIEERFGVQIAIRSRKGIEFTPEGEYLVRSACEMLEKMRAMDEGLKDMDAEISGTLRIGASHFCTKYLLPEILFRFKEQFPRVEFKLITGWSTDISHLVYNGGLHVGFIRSENSWSGDRHLLYEEKTFICSRDEINLEELPYQPQISYQSENAIEMALDRWWNENYNEPPYVTMEVDRVDTCREMVAKGLGYAFLPEMIARSIPHVFMSEMVFKTGTPFKRSTWVVANQETIQLKLVESFVGFVAGLEFPLKSGSNF